MKDDIKLPPLPKGDIYADTCPPMKVHTDQQLQDYARLAIETDRKRRSVPEGWQLVQNGEVTQFAKELSRAIAQAVLQLPEIQALRKDAERYRYLKKGNQWIVAATQTGWHVDGGELDALIDSALEEARTNCKDNTQP